MRFHRVAAGTRLALAIAVVMFMAAMLVSLVRLDAQREADSRVDRLGIWSTAQAQTQLARFQVAVERYVTRAEDVGAAELLDAFELLWSRIPLLATKNRPGLDATPGVEIAPVIERLDAILAEVEPDVLRLAQGGRGEVYGRVTAAMQDVDRLLADLNQKIHDERLAAELEKQLRVAALYRGLLISLLALLVSGGTLIALLDREMRRAQRLAVVADEAHAAAAAVSRDLQAVIDAVPAAITATDRQGRYLFMNRFQAERLGLAPQDVVGRLPSELGLDPAVDDELRAVAASGRAMPFVEQTEPDGTGLRTLLTSKVPVRDASGAVVRVVHVALDITERKLAEEQARHLAHHDALTGLPNRAFLNEALHRALARAVRSGQRIALHLIDLDRFKEINDTLGHPAGDAMLVEVAARMACCIREGDTLARMGGDEFAILQEGLADAGEAASMTQRLLAALAAPIRLAGQEITCGASIGVALGPADGAEVAELIRHADLALYRAKSDGRNLARFYEPAMNVQLRDRLELEQALRAALAAEAFELHYQPKYRLADDRLVGVEALIRWRHPERGLVPPDRFIALAEDTGLIVPLGNWVLREACRQARRLLDLGLQPGRIAVNLSAEQLRRQNVVAAVEDALAAAGVDAALLELELTESLLVRDAEHALRVMRDLKALGVTLALDDFGTGYSALAYLQRFPFDTLKIDRGFVCALGEPGGSSLRIVEAVVRLAHGLGLAVVAEGVETTEQRDTLLAVGCDQAQGYLYSRPVEAPKLVELLRGMPALPRPPSRRPEALAEAVA